MDKAKQHLVLMVLANLVIMPILFYLLMIKLLHKRFDLAIGMLIALNLYAFPYALASYHFEKLYGKTISEVQFSQKDPKTGSDWVVFLNFRNSFIYFNAIFVPMTIATIAFANDYYIVSLLTVSFAVVVSVAYYRRLMKMKYMGK